MGAMLNKWSVSVLEKRESWIGLLLFALVALFNEFINWSCKSDLFAWRTVFEILLFELLLLNRFEVRNWFWFERNEVELVVFVLLALLVLFKRGFMLNMLKSSWSRLKCLSTSITEFEWNCGNKLKLLFSLVCWVFLLKELVRKQSFALVEVVALSLLSVRAHSLHLSAIEWQYLTSRLFSSVEETDDESTLALVSLKLVTLLLVLQLLFIFMLFKSFVVVFEDEFSLVTWPLVPSLRSHLESEFLRLESDEAELAAAVDILKHCRQIRCILHSSVIRLASFTLEQ